MTDSAFFPFIGLFLLIHMAYFWYVKEMPVTSRYGGPTMFVISASKCPLLFSFITGFELIFGVSLIVRPDKFFGIDRALQYGFIIWFCISILIFIYAVLALSDRDE